MQEIDYREALRRIERIAAALASCGAIGIAWQWGVDHAIGFAAGSVLAFLSFFLIKRVVNSITPTAKPEDRPAPASTAAGVIVRYLVIGATVFAIMRFTGTSAWPVFAGLMTIVAAVIAEILYELAAAF